MKIISGLFKVPNKLMYVISNIGSTARPNTKAPNILVFLGPLHGIYYGEC